MGFWNKLGKIALTAAPYVAAPFTGGASLAFAPAANQAVGMWSAHDAANAAKKGLGPSSFDKYVGLAGSLAGAGSSAGAFGKTFTPPAAGSLSGWQGNLQKFGNMASQFTGQPGIGQQLGMLPQTQGQAPGIGPSPAAIQNSGVMPRGGFGYRQNPLNQFDQSSPNLSMALHQGRTEAMRNQPWRSGYDVQTQGPDDTMITNRMPPITPNAGRRNRRASA